MIVLIPAQKWYNEKMVECLGVIWFNSVQFMFFFSGPYSVSIVHH